MTEISFISLDFETATSNRNSICEVGITVVESGEINYSRSWLVQPPSNRYDKINIQVHGITPYDTANSPTFDQIWQELNSIFENHTLVAHNASFDFLVLMETLIYYNIPIPTINFYCSYRVAKYIFTGKESYSLPRICGALGINMGKHHRAEGDSLACATLFLTSLRAIDCHDIDSLQDIYNFTKGLLSPSGYRGQLSRGRKRGLVVTCR
ncbi:MAG: 3'-5' exonuclease [Bacteroidales bacterium]